MGDNTTINIPEGNPTVPKDAAANKIKMIKLGLVVVLLAALVAGYLWWNNMHQYISTDDAKVSGDIVYVSPKVSGQLITLAVHEGDKVKPGQVLAELDKAQLKINLAQAKALMDLSQANYDKLPGDLKSAEVAVEKAQQTLAASQGQLKVAQVSYSDSQRNLSQSESLYQNGSISQEALAVSTSAATKTEAAMASDQATVLANQAAIEDAQAKLSSLDKTGAAIYRAQLEQTQAAFHTAQLNLDNSILKAPVSGTIVKVAATVGETIAMGQTILAISDLDSSWIDANIEEDKYGRLQLGQSVAVQVDAYPGITFNGHISELGGATQSTFDLIPSGNTSGNYTKVTQRFSCKIKVDKEGKILKPGMSAVINIHTGN